MKKSIYSFAIAVFLAATVIGLKVINDSVANPVYADQTSDNWSFLGDYGSHANEVKSISEGNNQVTVAIIDTGINYSNPYLNINNLLPEVTINHLDNPDDDLTNIDFSEDTSHATSIASIIANTNNSSLDYCGIAPDINVVSIKVRWDGNIDNLYLPDVVDAVNWCTSNNVEIINFSGGFYLKYRYDEHGYDTYYELGQAIANYPGLFVCAAGNDAIDFDLPESYLEDDKRTYPTILESSNEQINSENIVSVGASAIDGNPWVLSNHGDSCVTVFAPGQDVFSAGENGFCFSSGTSFACAIVSAEAALIKSMCGSVSSTELKNIIKQNVNSFSNSAYNSYCSSEGIVDIYKALKAAALNYNITDTNLTKNNNNDCVYRLSDNAFVFGGETSQIPSSITKIASYAFNGINQSFSIHLPSNVTRVDGYAFNECSNLQYVLIENQQICISIDDLAFSNINNNFKIYVPNSLVDIYRANVGANYQSHVFGYIVIDNDYYEIQSMENIVSGADAGTWQTLYFGDEGVGLLTDDAVYISFYLHEYFGYFEGDELSDFEIVDISLLINLSDDFEGMSIDLYDGSNNYVDTFVVADSCLEISLNDILSNNSVSFLLRMHDDNTNLYFSATDTYFYIMCQTYNLIN